MPKLKSALASHQAHQDRLKAQAKSGKVKEDKERSVKYGKQKQTKKGKGERLQGQGGLVRSTNGEKQGQPTYTSVNGLGTSMRAAVNLDTSGGRGLAEDAQPGESSTFVTELAQVEESEKSNAKGKGKAARRLTNPIEQDDTVLLLGEANFSFAIALISPPHSHPAQLVCATSYDSEETCYTKYPDARSNVSRLCDAGVKVGFDVDAGQLEKSKGVVGKGKRWSRVVFNFPHVGAGIKDQERNILSNQHLLLRTFRSVALLLTEGPSRIPSKKSGEGGKKKRKRNDDDDDDEPLDKDEEDHVDGLDNFDDFDDYPDYPDYPDPNKTVEKQTNPTLSPPKKQGTMLITLLNQPPYTLWSLPRLGTRPPPLCPGTKLPQPRYELLRSFTFEPALWPGYEHRRTLGFKEGVSKAGNQEIVGRKGEARTWEFALRAMEED